MDASAVTPPPEDLAELLGTDPLTRLEMDWDMDTMGQGIVQLGLMLQAAGVEDFVSILSAIQPDVERMVSVGDNAPAKQLAATLVMTSLNTTLRKAKADCRFDPIEGENAWRLRRMDAQDDAAWPRWIVPELVVALLGLVTIVAVSWLLFSRAAYPWLAAYLALTVGSAVVSVKTRASTSVPLRVGISVAAISTSAVGALGLFVPDDPSLAIGVAGVFALLHLAQFGLNAWKRATIEPATK